MPSRDNRDLGAERITRADFARRVDEGRKGDAQTSGAVIGADVDVVSIGIENAANGETLWSKRIRADDAKGGDLVSYAAWYVGGLVQCAQSSLSVGERLKDVDLFGFFVRACDSWRSVGFEPMLDEARRVHALAPNLLTTRLKYSVAAAWVAAFTNDADEREKLHATATELAQAALVDSPEIGRAYYSLGVIDYGAARWASAEENFRRAIELEPDFPYTYNMFARISARTGRWREATDFARRAIVADRYSFDVREWLAASYAADGALAQAYALLDEIAPVDRRRYCAARFEIDHWYGDGRAALDAAQTGCMRDVLTERQRACTITYLTFRLTGENAADVIPACGAGPYFDQVRYAAAAGDREAAFAAFASRTPSWRDAALLFYPETRILRTDPRFKALAERYGVTDYWNATGKWPDFCDRAGQGDDCSQYRDFAPL